MSPSIRSIFGTKGTFYLDMSQFSVLSGWGNVYSFTQRVLGLAVFVVASSTLFPIWSPGQPALQYEVSRHTEQLHELAGIPTKVALMDQRLQGIEATQAEIKSTVAEINARAMGVTVTVAGALLLYLLNLFGARFKKEG